MATIPPLHVHVSIATGPHDLCPHCGGPTALVIASRFWDVDEEGVSVADWEKLYCDGVQIDAEITGHYCNTCDRLVSISVNQREGDA